jgi:hypothetical protein
MTTRVGAILTLSDVAAGPSAVAGASLLYTKASGGVFTRNAAGVESRIDGNVDDTGWIGFTPNSPWAAYGGGFAAPAYRRRRGVVYVKGLLNPNGATLNSAIFTLPAGFLPGMTFMVAAIVEKLTHTSSSNATNGTHTHGYVTPLYGTATRLNVTTGGVINFEDATGMAGSSYVSLNTIIFPAEA